MYKYLCNNPYRQYIEKLEKEKRKIIISDSTAKSGQNYQSEA